MDKTQAFLSQTKSTVFDHVFMTRGFCPTPSAAMRDEADGCRYDTHPNAISLNRKPLDDHQLELTSSAEQP